MTAKEKAKELYDRYEFVYIQNYTSKHEVKQCALIAVDEIIKSHLDWATEQDECVEFWEKVKQELNNL